MVVLLEPAGYSSRSATLASSATDGAYSTGSRSESLASSTTVQSTASTATESTDSKA